jgi:hypothetical protein
MASNHTKVLSLGVGAILAISAAPMYAQARQPSADTRLSPLMILAKFRASAFKRKVRTYCKIVELNDQIDENVRMLPSALRLKLSAVAESSSGASMTITMSYRPCVQNMSFTVTPNVSAICLKASARFGESLAFLTPCSVNLASTT